MSQSKYETPDFYRQFLFSLKIALIKLREQIEQVQDIKVLGQLKLREKFLRGDIANVKRLLIQTKEMGRG